MCARIYIGEPEHKNVISTKCRIVEHKRFATCKRKRGIKTVLHPIRVITRDRKSSGMMMESSSYNGKGAICWNTVWKEHKQSRSCSQLLWHAGRLHGHRSVHQPEGEHYTGHKVTRRKLTQKTDADTNRHAAGEDQLCLLGFHQSLPGKKMCLCFLTAPRDLFVNVTLVKSSATVSPVDATFFLEQRKPAGANDNITRWYLFYFIFGFFFFFFGHLQAKDS